jgi:2-keto-myo-inositol isomerase
MERGAVLFALNHIAAPKLGLAEFFSLAKTLGISSVEIRNDLAGNVMLDDTPAANMAAAAKRASAAYTGPASFEPFADSVHSLREAELRNRLATSMKLVADGARSND